MAGKIAVLAEFQKLVIPQQLMKQQTFSFHLAPKFALLDIKSGKLNRHMQM